jgi:hypothetical protein
MPGFKLFDDEPIILQTADLETQNLFCLRTQKPKQAFRQINEDVLLLQLVLSKVLGSLGNLKGANATLQHAINLNKTVNSKTLKTFFLLMEVYGSMTPPSIFMNAEIVPLHIQRQ